MKLSNIELIMEYLESRTNVLFNKDMLVKVFDNRGITITDDEIKDAIRKLIWKKFDLLFGEK